MIHTSFRRWQIGRALRKELRMIRAEMRNQRAAGVAPRIIKIVAPPPSDAPIIAPPPAAVEKAPGRQAIAMPPEIVPTMFGPMQVPWKPPIPLGANSALWEDCHVFAPGAKPQRDPHYGLIGGEPALSFVCPGCDLEQTPVGHGERSCGYCGLMVKTVGSRLFWWRKPAPEVAEWKP